jgi:hypothetical protein
MLGWYYIHDRRVCSEFCLGGTIEAPGETFYGEQKLGENISWRAWMSNRPVTFIMFALHIEYVMSMYRDAHSFTVWAPSDRAPGTPIKLIVIVQGFVCGDVGSER